MNGKTPSREFLASPTTVGFVVPDTPSFRSYAEEHPEIYITITLHGDWIVAYTDESNLRNLLADMGSMFKYSQSFIMGLLDEGAMGEAGIMQVHTHPFLNLRGSGTLVGIVDTGIDYTNDVFRYEDGTSKIVSIYDQTVETGTPPFDFFIGSEYNQEEINLALVSEDPLSIVPTEDLAGHGTYLASLAAGRPDPANGFISAAPDAELVVVKLRKARPYYLREFLVPPDQENAFETTAVMAGVEYIVRKAQQLGRPVAICIGLGSNYQAHDGLSIIENYLSRVSIIPGIAVCTGVGNETNARRHYSGMIQDTEQPYTVELRVGDNAGDVYLSIWNTAADRISVSITSPSGEIVQRVPPVDLGSMETRLILERAIVIIEYYFPSRGLGKQNTVIKILNATSGIWTITLYGEIILQGNFHAWLPMSGFVAPGVEFLMPDPYYTAVTPSAALQVISVGGYNHLTNSLYANSSWGPATTDLLVPDFVAPAVNVLGVFPRTGYGARSGTSAAAAITAGASALMLEWGIVQGRSPAMSSSQIRAFLVRGAMRTSGTIYPNEQWGFGRLDLYNSFEALR